jgi:LuxR family maltose regulon positive regulatory protein
MTMSARTALRPEPGRVGVPHLPRLRLAPEPGPRRPQQRGPRREAIARLRLVRALIGDPRPIAVLVGPAGYGKTALLAEWETHDPRPFAWVAVGPVADDAGALVVSVATALSEIDPPAGGAATLDDLLLAIGAASPSVVVLDGTDALCSPSARDVVAAIAGRLPPGTTLALASRAEPPLPLARLRAAGDVAELRADRLAMTRAEAAELVHRAGLRLAPAQMEHLLALAAGWPAALSLTAHALRGEDDVAGALAAFGGHDPVVAAYVRDELLAHATAAERAFLRRSSVLDELSGDACDAVLERQGSALLLRRLAGTLVPLTPLDRTRQAFRQHPLVRQALRAELHATEPQLEAELHRRASELHERAGDAGRAVGHAIAGRDTTRVARLLAVHAPGAVASGGAATVDGWLAGLPAGDVAADPALATAKALGRLVAGERDAAERWLAAAGRHPRAHDDSGAGMAVIAAAVARDGVAQMAADAERAHALAAGDVLRAFAAFLLGTARLLGGDAEGAGDALAEGARLAVLEAPLVRALCLAVQALPAADRDRHEAAELSDAAEATLARHGLADQPFTALSSAVAAVCLAQRGRLDAARGSASAAARHLARLPDAPPWYGALTRLALARCELLLSDVRAARTILGEASRLAARTDGAAGLRTLLDEAWARADDYSAGAAACPTALTIAELRVVRFLPSHLSFREIAARLHVSANTVKTQAHAAYRKLDATSRSEAVARARALGLVEG